LHPYLYPDFNPTLSAMPHNFHAHNIDASHCDFNDVGQNQFINCSGVTVHNTSAEARNSVLAELKPVDQSGCYVSPCDKGTRQWIFEKIDTWLQDREAPNIFLLTGSPGAGKSAIAWTMKSRLQEKGLLGSAFFCKRDDVTLSDPTTIWRTIAFDLAQSNSNFCDKIIENVKARRVDPTRVDIGLHFKTLIEDPANWVSEKYAQMQGGAVMGVDETRRNSGGIVGVTPGQSSANPIFPVVILDALDECGSDPSQSTPRRIFMHTITKWFHLHPMFKLLITSRDQGIMPTIRNGCCHIALETGDLVSAQSNLDIQCFFKHRFDHIASLYPSLSTWPGEATITRLTDLAAGLFIWAETVVRFMEKGSPTKQLMDILDGNFREPEDGDGIDNLYRQILHLSFENAKSHVLLTFKRVVGTILLAKIPLHRNDLYQLLGLSDSEDESSIDFILEKLSSVISSRKADYPIHIIHLSFREFMCDPKRCDDQLDLAPRIKEAIPSHLFYSCLFGAEHLQASAFDVEILQEVWIFMYTRLLFWLEVLGLLKEVKTALRALLLIRGWSSVSV
jgi:hypothetical protein